METVDLNMKLTDEKAFDEIKKLLDFLPEDDAVRAEYLKAVLLRIVDL